MKKIGLFILMMQSLIMVAQTPDAVKYQAVIRDNNGDIVASQNISLKISFLKGSTSGVVVYSESHATSTNEFGLVNVAAGSGTVISGDFTSIDWGENIYFMKTEADPAGGSNYELLGISQVLAVPYSFYAEEAGNVVYSDTSATNELQIISRDSLILSLSNGGGEVSIADNDNDPGNEFQVLSLSNDTLYLTNGGYVDISQLSVPPNGCINSQDPNPPMGYFFSGDFYQTPEFNWEELDAMPTIRINCGCINLNNDIYVVGGKLANNPSIILDLVEVYNSETESWSTIASLQHARWNPKTAIANDKLYVFGGMDGTTLLNIVEEYDPIILPKIQTTG